MLHFQPEDLLYCFRTREEIPEITNKIFPCYTCSVSTLSTFEIYSMRRELKKVLRGQIVIHLLHVYLLMLIFVALGVGHPSLPGSLLFHSKFKTKLGNPSSTNTSHLVDCKLYLVSVVLQGNTRLPLQMFTGASRKTKSGRMASRRGLRPMTTMTSPPVQPRKTKSQRSQKKAIG
jgi:hypothetical protein